MQQTLNVGRRAVFQHTLNGRVAQAEVERLVGDTPTGGQPQFEAETVRHLGEKGVERSDSQSVQAGGQAFEQVLARLPIEPLVRVIGAQEIGQLLARSIVETGRRQTQHDAIPRSRPPPCVWKVVAKTCSGAAPANNTAR